jgi:hypothetical protein
MKSYGSAVLLASCLVVAPLCVSPLLALDEGLLQFASPEATEIAGLNVDRASSSRLAAELVNRFAAFGKIHEVVLVSNAGVGLVAARGEFDKALIAGNLKETYGGIELYAGRRGSDLVAFPEPTLALYGDARSLKAALDRRGTPVTMDPALNAKVRDIGVRYDAWFAAKGRNGLKFGRAKLPDDTLRFVSGGITLGDVVKLDAEAVMKSEQDALGLVQLVKFLSGMDKNKGFLHNADARVDGSTVFFSASATEAELEQLFGIRRRTAALVQ